MSSASVDELPPKELTPPEQIARDILTKVKTVSLIEARAACSVVFDCTLVDDRHVCMKVSFVREPSAELLSFVYTPNSSKFTTTEVEAEKTRERQHLMHDELKAYNQLEFIPDAFGSCTLTPLEFNEYFKVKSGQLDHLGLISRKAEYHGVSIHILFMELLTDVGGYKQDDDNHVRNTPYIVAAILAGCIVTGVISQDMHPDNVQISINADGTIKVLKLIDWDRSISISIDSSDDLTGWIDSLMDNNVPLSLFVCNYFTDVTLKRLIGATKTQQQWETSKNEIKDALRENFTKYYKDLFTRILNLKSGWHLRSPEEKRYDIFDLLTFIGFMDCLLTGTRNAWTITTMQFSPFLYNLFNTREIKIVLLENSNLRDVLTLRQKYLESLKSLPDSVPSKLKRGADDEAKLARVEEVLDEIIPILDNFLVPHRTSGKGGRPRYLKRTRHKTIKKQQRNKNNRKSIKRIHRRSKIRKRNTRN
jgi:hypothetical protein